jgi:hypothetical protein
MEREEGKEVLGVLETETFQKGSIGMHSERNVLAGLADKTY